MFCQFLLYSKVTQSLTHTHTHTQNSSRITLSSKRHNNFSPQTIWLMNSIE
uniref:Uncharacterized protein n=1 Tax=Rhizophora mucronata TaxID=61149 RepID=A0A2P2NVN1_RHIMU